MNINKSGLLIASLLGAGLTAAPVRAQTSEPVAPTYAPAAPVAPEYAPEQPFVPRVGGALLVGGGFDDFTDGNLRRMSSGGGYWTVRGVGGTRRLIGVEAAYVGSAHTVDALGLGSNARLVSNGAEGALRLNIPVEMPQGLIEPFGFAGLGWARYTVMNTNVNNSDLASRDDVMTVPWGAGLELGSHGFMADARFTYRHTYFNNLLPGSSLNSWGIGGQIGFGY